MCLTAISLPCPTDCKLEMQKKYSQWLCFLSTVFMCTLTQLCVAKSHSASPFLTGPLGLNTTPSARMDDSGTIRVGISTLDPYIHGYLGVQLAKPLYINLRQTAEISGLNEDAKHLYPGLDFKLRLFKETQNRPEISIGVQSAIGHKRMAGEYIAASKRYKNMDFTMGLGWGRYGSAAHIKNPLRILGPHFTGNRLLDGENTNTPSKWFTGDTIGIFGGIELFLPPEGLSLKVDYGADDYLAEANSSDYNHHSPWAIGLSYSPNQFVNASIGTLGTDKVMGRISFSGHMAQWPLRSKYDNQPPEFYETRPDITVLDEKMEQIKEEDIVLRDIGFDNQSVSASLQLDSRHSTMHQIGRAARLMAKNTDNNIEVLEITPFITNIRGPKITLLRSDFEKALITHDGSPQEIWQNTEFTVSDAKFLTHNSSAALDNNPYNKHRFGLHLEQDFSLAEEDHGLLHRTSLILEHQQDGFLGFLSLKEALRVNLAHNFEHLNASGLTGTTKGDLDLFADSFLTLNHAYANYSRSLGSSWHGALNLGYLEEFYLGAGAQVLYRPFSSRFAIGGEIWDAIKRDPYTALNMGWTGDTSLSGHVELWYDVPSYEITMNAKAGRFLAGDKGVEFGAYKSFENGAKISGNIVLSDKREDDVFGGSTHSYHSLNLTVPFGSLRLIPDGSQYRLSAKPLGRNYGQSIDIQSSLYEQTNKITLRHLANNFKSLLD